MLPLVREFVDVLNLGELTVPDAVSLAVTVYFVYALTHIAIKVGSNITTKMINDHLFSHFPEPKGSDVSWFFGIVKGVVENKHRMHDFRLDMMRRGGFPKEKTILLPGSIAIPFRLLVTADPKVIKFILKDSFQDFDKSFKDHRISPIGGLFNEWMRAGIFAARHSDREQEYKAWIMQRKVAAKIFTRNAFKTLMRDTFVRKGHILVNALKSGEPVDMQHKFFAFTMDSISSIFFGRETNTMVGERDVYADAFDGAHRAFLDYGTSNLPIFFLMANLPFPFGPLYGSAYGSLAESILRRCSAQGRAFGKHVATLRKESRRIIEERMAEKDLSDKRDLLALFINAKSPEGEPMDDPRFIPFLTDIVLSMVIAGRDTTACTLSWLMYELCRNPSAQEKLYAELSAAKGEGSEGEGGEASKELEDPTFDSVSHKKLPYLNGCVYEALRLHPPVPFDPKQAQRDVVLPDGRKIYKGAVVAYLPYVTGRDETVYENPEEFRPERWIPFKQPNQYEFPVFQGGPRICLGMNMALFEAKLLTSMLFSRFRFKMCPGEAEKIGYSLMLTMSIRNSRPGETPTHALRVVPELR